MLGLISVSTFSWLFAVALALFVVGRWFKDYTIGIFGGFAIFLLGVYVLIERITGLTEWFSAVIGMVLFGVGAYIFIQGSLEALRDR